MRGVIESQSLAGTRPQEIANKLLIDDPKLPLKEQDLLNVKSRMRLRNLDGRTPLAALFYELELDESCNYNWAYATLEDENEKIIRLFLCRVESARLLKDNPELLILDSTYKTNRFGLPLLNIIGVDYMQKTFFVGFCFLSEETESAYC